MVLEVQDWVDFLQCTNQDKENSYMLGFLGYFLQFVETFHVQLDRKAYPLVSHVASFDHSKAIGRLFVCFSGYLHESLLQPWKIYAF
jgi:hypothetical protein